jgi:hypothetical protein
MTKVVKTTFEEEQEIKDKHFLSLSPLQRWEVALKVRNMMRRPDVNYSYEGSKVRIKKLSK